MQISIIGAGKWGRALKHAFSLNHSCFITSHSKHEIENFVSVKEALKSEFLVFALSSQGLYAWLKQNFKNEGQKILLASKGIDTKHCKFLDEIFLEFVEKNQICVLSGPSFATEVIQNLPCALVISGENKRLCEKFASFFPNFIKTYINDDVRGAEICFFSTEI